MSIVNKSGTPRRVILNYVRTSHHLSRVPKLRRVVVIKHRRSVVHRLGVYNKRLNSSLAFIGTSRAVSVSRTPTTTMHGGGSGSLAIYVRLVGGNRTRTTMSTNGSNTFTTTTLFALNQVAKMRHPMVTAVLPARGSGPVIIISSKTGVSYSPS